MNGGIYLPKKSEIENRITETELRITLCDIPMVATLG